MKGGKSNKIVDLRKVALGTKPKKEYAYNDEELKEIIVDQDVTIKLIKNEKGVFVDIRKYYKGYPTKKGVRIEAGKFRDVISILNVDLKEIPIDDGLKELENI